MFLEPEIIQLVWMHLGRQATDLRKAVPEWSRAACSVSQHRSQISEVF